MPTSLVSVMPCYCRVLVMGFGGVLVFKGNGCAVLGSSPPSINIRKTLKRTEKTEAPIDDSASFARASRPGSRRGTNHRNHRNPHHRLPPPLPPLASWLLLRPPRPPPPRLTGFEAFKKAVATCTTNSTASPTAMTRFTTETALIRTP